MPLMSLGRNRPKRFPERSSSMGRKREFVRADVLNHGRLLFPLKGTQTCLSGFSLDKAKHLDTCPASVAGGERWGGSRQEESPAGV